MLINNANKANNYLRRVMRFEQEEFWVLCLSSSLRLLCARKVFLGTVDRCLVHPRDIFRFAIQKNASRIMVAHNHPMGGTTPSQEDLAITKRLVSVGELIGIPVVDHIIVDKNQFHSLSQAGQLEPN